MHDRFRVLALLAFLFLGPGCGDDKPPPQAKGGPGAKGSADSIFRSMQKDAPSKAQVK